MQLFTHFMICIYAKVILNYPIFRIKSTSCCIRTVVPPDDGPRYARNTWRLTKYSKNKSCIELVFLYTIISRCAVDRT